MRVLALALVAAAAAHASECGLPFSFISDDVYYPSIRAEDFSDPTTVTNPWFPLAPGMVWKYQGINEFIIAEVMNFTLAVFSSAI